MASQSVNKQHIVMKFYTLLGNLFSEIWEDFHAVYSNKYRKGYTYLMDNNDLACTPWFLLYDRSTMLLCKFRLQIKMIKTFL